MSKHLYFEGMNGIGSFHCQDKDGTSYTITGRDFAVYVDEPESVHPHKPPHHAHPHERDKPEPHAPHHPKPPHEEHHPHPQHDFCPPE